MTHSPRRTSTLIARAFSTRDTTEANCFVSVISVVAVPIKNVPVSFLQVMMKQLTIRGAMEYPARFESALELLARRDLSAMVTHTFGIEEFGDALAMLQASKECGKVLITMADLA